ncbi:hypothetical protein IGI04_002351 [Brassica rapa subsp. trilocularis]|uniref:Uncharacterized protein n=1 Tax=Brassica rapa subsp. trilocularis TaxID=1813537 RepID=A0ABQ7NVA9_BRACM|nr:hypothetical protein IGI04_002351 [Brassica rapa subsp. trilocularis]
MMILHVDGCHAWCFLIKGVVLDVGSPMALPQNHVKTKLNYLDAPVQNRLFSDLPLDLSLMNKDGLATGARVVVLFFWILLTCLRAFTIPSHKVVAKLPDFKLTKTPSFISFKHPNLQILNTKV